MLTGNWNYLRNNLAPPGLNRRFGLCSPKKGGEQEYYLFTGTKVPIWGIQGAGFKKALQR